MDAIFNYNGSQIRTVLKNGEAWFVLKDACDILGLAHRVVRQRISDDVCSTYPIPDNLGRTQDTTIINEDGLYDVILESRKLEAKAFRKWITSEVLPSIRKHGAYMTPEALEAALSNPDTMIQILTRLKEEQTARAAAEHKIQLDAPKVALYDTAMSAGNDFTMERVSKTLGYGRNKLFQFLRDQKILRLNNLPYQEYIDRGYFNVRQYSITHLTQGIENKTQTLVTPKGMAFIHDLLRKHGKTA